MTLNVFPFFHVGTTLAQVKLDCSAEVSYEIAHCLRWFQVRGRGP
jgi:hypothetical protein